MGTLRLEGLVNNNFDWAASKESSYAKRVNFLDMPTTRSQLIQSILSTYQANSSLSSLFVGGSQSARFTGPWTHATSEPGTDDSNEATPLLQSHAIEGLPRFGGR